MVAVRCPPPPPVSTTTLTQMQHMSGHGKSVHHIDFSLAVALVRSGDRDMDTHNPLSLLINPHGGTPKRDNRDPVPNDPPPR